MEINIPSNANVLLTWGIALCGGAHQRFGFQHQRCHNNYESSNGVASRIVVLPCGRLSYAWYVLFPVNISKNKEIIHMASFPRSLFPPHQWTPRLGCTQSQGESKDFLESCRCGIVLETLEGSHPYWAPGCWGGEAHPNRHIWRRRKVHIGWCKAHCDVTEHRDSNNNAFLDCY